VLASQSHGPPGVSPHCRPHCEESMSLGGLKSSPLLIKFRISSKCKLRGKCSISRPNTSFCNFVALFVTEGHRLQIFTLAGF